MIMNIVVPAAVDDIISSNLVDSIIIIADIIIINIIIIPIVDIVVQSSVGMGREYSIGSMAFQGSISCIIHVCRVWTIGVWM